MQLRIVIENYPFNVGLILARCLPVSDHLDLVISCYNTAVSGPQVKPQTCVEGFF